ncbi:hypothetical protein TNCV_3369461 [Trichonephila clavipes]|uniref:Uncharacterized protein n=1 Tax=Trichonephila clavipes TaxID=2585209 RepID=A0A8X6UPL7_TRICX|nr:hypothetical protein TNCV_3369461 [Trichonephila clavipes]
MAPWPRALVTPQLVDHNNPGTIDGWNDIMEKDETVMTEGEPKLPDDTNVAHTDLDKDVFNPSGKY